MSALSVLFVSRPEHVTPVFSSFKECGVSVLMSENLEGALQFIQKSSPRVVFTQKALPGYRAEDLLRETATLENPPDVIVFTSQGSADEARTYLEFGARDYWLTPLVWEKVEAALGQRRPSSQRGAPAAFQASQKSVPRTIIGSHPAIRRVLALARQVAPSRATVLISGESGTGKEMFARLLHEASGRRDKPFVAVNCAALPEHLLESELFGHEKGAFTGAIQKKPGKFERAHGGTLLLDEISEMAIGLQAKLLRALQEGEVDRVGGTETISVDVRVVATTNRKIEDSVASGEFRQDLYYRLNVIPLKLPSLRDRGEDILDLARFFITRYSREYGFPEGGFSEEARTWLLEYPWPGNVRELQNLMERSVLLASGAPIRPAHFLLDGNEDWPLEEDTATVAPVQDSGAAGGEYPHMTEDAGGDVLPLQEMEKRLILKSLDQTAGNRTQASKMLGISVRTLRNKLNEYRKQGLSL